MKIIAEAGINQLVRWSSIWVDHRVGEHPATASGVVRLAQMFRVVRTVASSYTTIVVLAGILIAGFVVAYVVCPREKFQILDSVVRLVPVDMVDHFISFKVSSQVLLHDESMLKQVATPVHVWVLDFADCSPPDSYIPVAICVSTAFPEVALGTFRPTTWHLRPPFRYDTLT